LVDEDSKQAFRVLYNLGASTPDPWAASVVVGSTLRDGKERQFFALGAFGFRRRILKAVICHADGEVCFVRKADIATVDKSFTSLAPRPALGLRKPQRRRICHIGAQAEHGAAKAIFSSGS
jgi:hypothetical protein